MDYINAFWVGGLICALVQILMEKTKLMPGRIMVLLVCTGALLGAIGLYEPFQEFAGAGASVPLLGFGNTLMKGVKEAVDEQGFLGLFSGGFKAGAVGTAAALIFGYVAALICSPKMKKYWAINDKRRLADWLTDTVRYCLCQNGVFCMFTFWCFFSAHCMVHLSLCKTVLKGMG